VEDRGDRAVEEPFERRAEAQGLCAQRVMIAFIREIEPT
jgi:hypothetical protein